LFGFESPRKNGKFIYTSDSFQGGEADVVIASLVRNNLLVGTRALGFIKNPQRMNVLLSRAKQKLVLATSQQFIREAVDGVDPDHLGGELEFLRTMLGEISRLTDVDFDGVGKGAAIISVDERGGLLP
jgi:superfamily I DNA and/or RNA helicase